MKKYISLILSLAVIICFLTGCSTEKSKTQMITVTDLLGREVAVPTNAERIVCIGASALRLYCYVGDMDRLVGVEEFEKSEKMPVRPYSYAYKEKFAQLPSIGAGGANSAANAEAIAAVKPDLIFSLYNSAENMDALQNQTGIPVVCLSYGGSDPFSENVFKSIGLMGDILGRQERAETVIGLIKSFKADINRRSAGASDAEKCTVYLGSNTYNGGKGSFGDTLVNYAPFRELNAKNVLSKENYGTNNPTLDYERIIELDPDKVFVDAMNVGTLAAEYSSHREIFDSLSAFKNGEIYVQMPFNQYYTNLETAIADTYYIGKILYPEAFSDVDAEKKFDEICSLMLDKDLDYYSISAQLVGMGFGKLDMKGYLK